MHACMDGWLDECVWIDVRMCVFTCHRLPCCRESLNHQTECVQCTCMYNFPKKLARKWWRQSKFKATTNPFFLSFCLILIRSDFDVLISIRECLCAAAYFSRHTYIYRLSKLFYYYYFLFFGGFSRLFLFHNNRECNCGYDYGCGSGSASASLSPAMCC